MKVSKKGKSVTVYLGDRVIIIREDEALELLEELKKVLPESGRS
jgi:hydrogenase maturation factor